MKLSQILWNDTVFRSDSGNRKRRGSWCKISSSSWNCCFSLTLLSLTNWTRFWVKNCFFSTESLCSLGDAVVIPLSAVVLHANTSDGATRAHEVLTCLNSALAQLSNQSWSASLLDGRCFAFSENSDTTAAEKHTGDFIDYVKALLARVVRGPFGSNRNWLNWVLNFSRWNWQISRWCVNMGINVLNISGEGRECGRWDDARAVARVRGGPRAHLAADGQLSARAARRPAAGLLGPPRALHVQRGCAPHCLVGLVRASANWRREWRRRVDDRAEGRQRRRAAARVSGLQGARADACCPSRAASGRRERTAYRVAH